MAKRWPVWVRFNRVSGAWEVLSVSGEKREYGADDVALAEFRNRNDAVSAANAMNARYKSSAVLGRPIGDPEPPRPSVSVAGFNGNFFARFFRRSRDA